MAIWKKVLTEANDADYKNNSIEAGDLPAHSGALITSGTVASARLDSDTAHLSGTQTFSGAKTFSSTATFAVSGDYAAEFQSDVKIIESGSNPRLIIGDDTGGSGYGEINWNSSANSIQLGTATSGADTLILDQSDNATFSGNVGVGINPTTYPFQVDGHMRLESNGRLFLGAGGAIADSGSNTWFIIPKDGANKMLFKTANVTALSIDSSQNATFGGTVNATTFVGALTGNASGSSATCSGLAGSATVLANTRTFRTNLSSTSFANFNGGANVTPGVTGTLPVSYGGTGQTGATGTGKLVLWDSPNLQGSPIIGGTTFPSSTGTAKQILENNGLGSAAWSDNFPNNVKYFYQQWSMRWYMRYGYAYYPSTSYGPGYYNWNKYSISPITSWLDSWNLGYVVPESATFKGAELLGSTNNTETLQLKILKGTPSSYSNSSTSVTIGSIYAPTAESFTSGRRNSMGSTSAVSVSVSKGDIIVPQLNKTSNINSTTRYLYGTLVLKFQKA